MLSRMKPFLAGSSLAGLLLASGGVIAEEELSGPEEDVQESVEVLQQMKEQAPELAARLSEAKGVFIIPDYATASLLVGGSGGEGVMMYKGGTGEWGNPGFYDVGNIDIGAQAGAAAGSIVMLLMSDKAVQSFQEENDFSLTAQAGLTLINWSAQAPATTEDGDALVWSDTEGLLAEASVGIGGISWDEEEAAEYYNVETVTPQDVLAGNIENPHENVLQTEFAEFSTGAPETEEASQMTEPSEADESLEWSDEPSTENDY